MDGAAVRSVRLFGDICGEGFLENTAMVTTMWDMCRGPEEFDLRKTSETQLLNAYWGPLLRVDQRGGDRVVEVVGSVENVGVDVRVGCPGGAMYARSDNKKETCESIIRQIVEKASKMPILQKDLGEGKVLGDTVAGAGLRSALDKMAKIHEQKLKELHQKLLKANQTQLAEVLKERTIREAQLAKNLKDQEALFTAREKRHREEMEIQKRERGAAEAAAAAAEAKEQRQKQAEDEAKRRAEVEEGNMDLRREMAEAEAEARRQKQAEDGAKRWEQAAAALKTRRVLGRLLETRGAEATAGAGGSTYNELLRGGGGMGGGGGGDRGGGDEKDDGGAEAEGERRNVLEAEIDIDRLAAAQRLATRKLMNSFFINHYKAEAARKRQKQAEDSAAN